MNGKPVCFVIMGFGKKTDFEIGKTIDLDKTYNNIIKPAAIAAGFDCVRADEIDDSGLIDKSMYALLLRAELVVADISTYNPNALYELGIRHASRPYSTIIIRARTDKKIPFDIDHTRIFQYDHLGDDIGAEEAKRCVDELSAKMKAVHKKGSADSPMYEMLTSIRPPDLSAEEYEAIIGDLAKRENTIFALRASAEKSMAESDFLKAAETWKKAAKLSDGDSYFVQQAALATSKTAETQGIAALTDALEIIHALDPDNSNDPETLGITGAIHKRIYLRTKDASSLDKALKYYKHGFIVAEDYYTGENYANCLDLKFESEEDPEQRTYLKIESQNTRTQIIARLERIDESEIISRSDAVWIYATLSNCYLALGNDERSDYWEKKFHALVPQDWQVETYNSTKEQIKKRRT